MLRAILWQTDSHPGPTSRKLLGLQPAERVVLNLRARGVTDISWWGPIEEMPHVGDAAIAPFTAEQLSLSLRQLSDGTSDGLLLVPSHIVTHPDAVPQLLQRAASRRTPQLLGPSPRDGLVLIPSSSDPALPDVAPGGDSDLTPEVLATALKAEPWSGEDAPFVVPLLDEGQRGRAQRALLELNWRPHDGIVARLINKHISVRISALLANTSITPNQMTTVAFLLALVGIALTARGSYLAVLAGAALIQLQSILDGCDGELARLRYQSSDWGGWYDTVVDDLIGALWLATLGIGSAHATGNQVWLGLGLAAAIASVLTATYVYTVLLRNGGKGHHEFTWWFEEGQPRSSGYPNPKALSTWAKYAVRRDFYVFVFFVLALFGQLTAITTLAVAGAAANFAVTAVQFAKRGMRLTRTV